MYGEDLLQRTRIVDDDVLCSQYGFGAMSAVSAAVYHYGVIISVDIDECFMHQSFFCHDASTPAFVLSTLATGIKFVTQGGYSIHKSLKTH